MNGVPGPRVLHVMPPGGGGVERCVRELLAARPGDLLLHVTAAQWVLERPGATPRFTPLSPDDVIRWASGGGLGAPLALHAHGTVPAVREACARLAAATGAPRLLTLHDIWFADPALPDDERAARLAFVRSADRCMAPSDFIVGRAKQVLGDAFDVRRVPLGARPFAPVAPDLPPPKGEFPVAVIGAIGAHKGLQALEALSALLPQQIVVLGYTERQLRPGWTADGRIRVHGLFGPDELPALVRHYGVRLALFPPGMPESHCYALSDAWMSGLTVLAPDLGALAERVRRHAGGGALYDPQLPVPELARRVEQALLDARRIDSGLPLQPPLPAMEDMMTTMNALYAALPPSGPPQPPDDDGRSLQALAQAHLDSAFMRREVTDLVLALDAAAAREAALQQRLTAAEQALVQAAAERDALRERHARLTQRLQSLLRWLPAPLRARLVARGRRALDHHD
ncbi:MAG: glycosyltransferase family 4 protein [Rubrivivax sp.]